MVYYFGAKVLKIIETYKDNSVASEDFALTETFLH